MKLHLVLELKDNIKIFADKLNWVLQINDPNNRSYFTTLDELCDNLLEVRLTKKLSGKVRKDITFITNSIKDTREAVRNDLERLETLMTNADRARQKGVFND